jgi:ribonuclease HI
MATKNTMKKIVIYTDGACQGNPGPGGWAAILYYENHQRELSGGISQTTNNRMEMTAAIEALSAVKTKSHITLHTDSEYVRQGITSWIHSWKEKNWKKSDNKPVKNADLWKKLDDISQQHEISWKWVKGHSGHPENEAADALAKKAMLAHLAKA